MMSELAVRGREVEKEGETDKGDERCEVSQNREAKLFLTHS